MDPQLIRIFNLSGQVFFLLAGLNSDFYIAFLLTTFERPETSELFNRSQVS